MSEKKTVIVTGAFGTIGRQVASALALCDWYVVGVGHGRWGVGEQNKWGVSVWNERDITLESLRELAVKPALVVHSAGSGDVGASVRSPHTDFIRTVTTTAAMLEFLRNDCPDASFVYPSSAAVYGVVNQFPMKEGVSGQPTSPYGVHKKIAEEMVVEYARLFGLKASVVRLFSVYGEEFRKQLLWDACQRISLNESLFFGTGEETRDWLHVDDAARLLIQAGNYASSLCPIVNGGFGESVSVRNVLTDIFRLMGRNDQPSFCGTQRPGDPVHYHADIGEALAWGWRPEVSWKDGLARYVSWFRKEHDLD